MQHTHPFHARLVPAIACVVIALAFTLLPLGASAACIGKLASLQSYAGKYLADANLLKAPELASRLQRLPRSEQSHLQRNLDVAGPIQLQACHLTVSGNAPHMGTEQDALLDVDLATGTVVAAIHGGGRIDIYVLADAPAGKPDWQSLPHDVRAWAVKADMGFPQQAPRSLAQPGSIRLHAPAASAASTPATPAAQSPGYPLKLQFDKDNITPSAAQIAAIRRAAADEIRDFNHPEQNGFSVVQADLNDDGLPDLLVRYEDGAFCGSAGCSGMILMATATGYASKPIDSLPNFYGEMSVLAGKHHGMHDLQYNGDSPVWKWNGKAYEVDKADLPGANAPPWQTRPAAGRTLAMAVPIASTIKSVSVFCDQGKPVLAMLLKMPRAPAATTLTWVFNGWSVNVPMQPAGQNGTLWMTWLSQSELPGWLAHRGNSRIPPSVAQSIDHAFLRINGQMEGQISLKDSTAATQAALASCYRY